MFRSLHIPGLIRHRGGAALSAFTGGGDILSGAVVIGFDHILQLAGHFFDGLCLIRQGIHLFFRHFQLVFIELIFIPESIHGSGGINRSAKAQDKHNRSGDGADF